MEIIMITKLCCDVLLTYSCQNVLFLVAVDFNVFIYFKVMCNHFENRCQFLNHYTTKLFHACYTKKHFGKHCISKPLVYYV